MMESNMSTLKQFWKSQRVLILCLAFLPLSATMAMPEGAAVVKNFSLERYLGTWYEVARLDHRFERGMTQVTATYSMRDDGGVRVLNRGYKESKSSWKEAEGKAYFIGDSDMGQLKVTFFWPFYGAYNIVALDQENYSYALVIGDNTKYMWILARETSLDPEVLEDLLKQAKELGFATDELIYPQVESAGN